MSVILGIHATLGHHLQLGQENIFIFEALLSVEQQ